MAPTVCLSELPIPRSTVVCPYTPPRRQNRTLAKQRRRLQSRRTESMNVVPGLEEAVSSNALLTPPESPLWEEEQRDHRPAATPSLAAADSSSQPARHFVARGTVPPDIEDHWRLVLEQREGLLDIVVRTMALVRRNSILQEKVNALRAETRDFIRSVLNNPENKCRQRRLLSCKEAAAAAALATVEPSLPPSPDSTSGSDLRNEPAISPFSSSSSVSSSYSSTAGCCYCSDWETDESVSYSSDES